MYTLYTVRELIEALQQCPQDNIVFCTNIDTGVSRTLCSVGTDLPNGTVYLFFESEE